MAKRIKYNINRIRAILYENHKNRFRFKSWKDTINVAKSIKDALKERGLSQSVNNIAKVVRELNPSKRRSKIVLVPEEYIRKVKVGNEYSGAPFNFYDVENLRKLIEASDNRIVFQSPLMLPKGVEIQGGTVLDYEKTFKDFIDLAAKIQRNKAVDGVTDYYKDELYWRVEKQPAYLRGRWLCTIISCDSTGTRTNYYLTREPEKELVPEEKKPEEIQEKIKPVVEEKPKEEEKEPKLSEASLKEIEIAKVKAKEQTASLERLLRDKVITFEQYLEGLKRIG